MNDLQANALIDLLEARRYVWRDENDGSRDDILIDAVNDVSDATPDYLRREILPRTDNLPRTFDYDGSGYLDLEPYDLRNIDLITLYSDRPVAEQVVLTTTNYRLWPTGGAKGGTFLGLLLPTPAVAEFDYGFGWQVAITGDWGMVADTAGVPGGIKLGVKQWVENIVKNPGAYASVNYGGNIVTPEVELGAVRAGMPPAVRHRFEPWRRKRPSGLQVIRFRHPNLGQPAVPHTLPTV